MTDEKIIELNNGTARTAKRALGMHSAKRDAPAQLEWKRPIWTAAPGGGHLQARP